MPNAMGNTASVRTLGLSRISAKQQSDVYLLDDRRVLKLFNQQTPLDAIEAEARTCALLKKSGLPVPAVESRVVLADDGRHGLVLEKFAGVPFSELFGKKLLKVAALTASMADIQAMIHRSACIDSLPQQRSLLRERITKASRISFQERQHLLVLLKNLPDAQQVCHGNFHPSNVMLSAAGDPCILSWGNATVGNAACDIARTAIILGYSRAQRSGVAGWIESAYLSLRSRIYVSRCLKAHAIDRKQFDHWLAVNAAVRIGEGIPQEQRDRLIGLIRRVLWES